MTRRATCLLLMACLGVSCRSAPRGDAFEDAGILTRVRTALVNDAIVGRRKIDVTVALGEVTLTGPVASDEEARQAVAVASRVTGVVSVVSRLRIEP